MKITAAPNEMEAAGKLIARGASPGYSEIPRMRKWLMRIATMMKAVVSNDT